MVLSWFFKGYKFEFSPKNRHKFAHISIILTEFCIIFFFSGLEHTLVNWSWQKIARILYLVAKVAKFVPIWRFLPYLLVSSLNNYSL